jgi:predicted transcriptional regulator
MKTFLVFVIQAYEEKLDDGGLRDVVTLELIDKDGNSAIKRAKKTIKKSFYRISQVIEKEIC